MGISMRALIERRTPDGRWEGRGELDYIFGGDTLCGLLGGCTRRTTVPRPIAPLRGVPADTAYPCLHQPPAPYDPDAPALYLAVDDYDHSWLTLAELRAADLEQTVTVDYRPYGGIEEEPLYYAGNVQDIAALLEAHKMPGQSDDDVRMVFWFDY